MENKSINILKVVAMLVVFILHTSIYSSALGFTFSSKTWILQTPAWAAVWVFIFVSGYLNGKSFIQGKYQTDNKWDIKKVLFEFYGKRIKKIYIPYVVFGFFVVVLIDQQYLVGNPRFFAQLLTATFTNIPSSMTVGVLWYVSTLIWLYIMAPLFALIIDKINKRHNNIKVFTEILFILSIGLVWRIYMYSKGADWSSQVYVPFYGNIDIFLCGMLINYFDSSNDKKIFSIFSSILLIILLIGNTWVYYLGNSNPVWINIYCFIFPTLYIIVSALFILGHRQKCGWKFKMFGKIVDFYANISFEFYMSHCVVLNAIYLNYVYADSPNVLHLKLLTHAFALTSVFAFFLHKAFTVKNSRVVKKTTDFY